MVLIACRSFAEKLPTINFIGNKEKLAMWILDNTPPGRTFVDAFSGGSSVSFEAKKRGFKVITNDILSTNYMLGKALVENKNITLNDRDVALIFSGKPIKGFMFKNYSNVIFYEKECMELDKCRKNIEKLQNLYKKALAISIMRRTMIRKMPYSRFTIPWAKVKQLRDEEFSYQKYGRRRAYHNLTFKEHFISNLHDYNNAVFDNGKDNLSYNKDVLSLLPAIKGDVIYLDPPYVNTMNNYHGFYGPIDDFIKSRKTIPFRNNFIGKEESLQLFEKLFSSLKNFKYWVLSYNSNSYPDKKYMTKLIKKHSNNIQIITRKHNYQISGSFMKSKNLEHLFIVDNNG